MTQDQIARVKAITEELIALTAGVDTFDWESPESALGYALEHLNSYLAEVKA